MTKPCVRTSRAIPADADGGRSACRQPRWPGLLAAVAGLACAAGLPAPVGAAVPQPCLGVPQISDASGDGHHPSTDVIAAWFSEASGSLQAVIKVRAGGWVPEHDDADINGSGFAILFTAGGHTRFARATAPPSGPVTYDYGTYTPGGGFVSAGPTTGEVAYAAAAGTATIDVPPALGASAGALLADPFVLTYDGISGGVPDWVDHAPGGVLPGDSARGADYVVGSCSSTAPPGTTPGGSGTPGGPGPGAVTTTSVQLRAPARVLGGGAATVTGRVLPARAGVAVVITRRARATATSRVTTGADGTFRVRIPIRETTRLRAAAEGIRSQEVRVTARSMVRISVRRLRSGIALVTGRVRPALPGRVLWIPAASAAPVATRTVTGSTFTFRLRNPARGRYQAVYIPSGNRAERSTSNTGVIR